MTNTRTVDDLPFLDGHTVAEYRDFVGRRHPDFAGLLDFTREGTAAALAGLPTGPRLALDQPPAHAPRRDGGPRATGIRHLLTTALGEGSESVLNIVGGDGFLATAARQLGFSENIVTSDVDEAKVVRALAQGLPAIRQHVTHLFVRAGSFDAVVAAYESHHIPSGARQAACAEAVRALRSGGRLVLSDFAAGSPITAWFREIVHPFTDTGHVHEHYTKAEFARLFSTAGLRDVHVDEVYDPIIVAGKTAERAVVNLVEYLVSIYRLADTNGRRRPGTAELEGWLRANMVVVGDDFQVTSPVRPVRGLTVIEADDGFQAHLPRLSLVAVGTKP